MIPTVDISSFFQASAPKEKQVEALGEALRHVGAASVIGHSISLELLAEVHCASDLFFQLPLAQKMEYYIGRNRIHRGYVPINEKGAYQDEGERVYEAFDLGLDLPDSDLDSLSGNRLLGPNLWPAIDGFQAKVGDYYRQVAQVARTIFTALEQYLKLPSGAFTRHMTKPTSQLRLIKYHALQAKAAPEKEDEVKMGAHTDYEALALIHQSQPGLEVMTPDQKWHRVPAQNERLTLNIGDMLEVWSNGIFRSTPHRVVGGATERSSLAYLAAFDYETIVTPDPSLVSEKQPAQYASIHAGEHIMRMLKRDFPYLRQKGEPNSQEESQTNPFEQKILKT